MGPVVLSEMLLCQQQSPPIISVQCFKFDATDNLNLINVESPPSFAHASVVTLTATGGTAICEIVRDQCREHHKGEIDVQDANLSEHFSPRNASCDICENTFTHTRLGASHSAKMSSHS